MLLFFCSLLIHQLILTKHNIKSSKNLLPLNNFVIIYKFFKKSRLLLFLSKFYYILLKKTKYIPNKNVKYFRL